MSSIHDKLMAVAKMTSFAFHVGCLSATQVDHGSDPKSSGRMLAVGFSTWKHKTAQIKLKALRR